MSKADRKRFALEAKRIHDDSEAKDTESLQRFTDEYLRKQKAET